MNSKYWDVIYWGFFVLYLISFLLPAADINRIIGPPLRFFGHQCALWGILCLFGIPAHISALRGLIHRLSITQPKSPCYAWTLTSLVFSIIGTLVWLGTGDSLLIGYYVWTSATIGMAIAYLFFRLQKSKEVTAAEAIRAEETA